MREGTFSRGGKEECSTRICLVITLEVEAESIKRLKQEVCFIAVDETGRLALEKCKKG